MTYLASWTNGNSQQRLECGHRVRLSDPQEMAMAINRRRSLTYQAPDDFSTFTAPGSRVRRGLLHNAVNLPFEDFRDNLCYDILSPPVGSLGGQPPSPTNMQWLWPLADNDENKLIVLSGPQSGQVGLFERLNGTTTWTDPTLVGGSTMVRAVHFNELRQTVEWLTRGRWILPVYFSCGLFSMLPDTPWFGGAIANNGSAELRTIGFCIAHGLAGGLTNVTVRTSSYLELWADADCQAAIHQCLRHVDFTNDRSSWNEYAPAANGNWATPGGIGQGDSGASGTVTLSSGGPVRFGGQSLAAIVQAMVNGMEQNLLLRRVDSGSETVSISGRLVVEFDLASPPN